MNLPSTPSSIKQALLTQCREFVEARIEAAEQVIRMAQASANEESKSSAGDKYETGRAMAQLEIEKGIAQLAEANMMMQAVNRVPSIVGPAVIQLGSLIYTNHGNYFLSVGVGRLMFDGVTWYAISPASPIGSILKGLHAGDSFKFNQKAFAIEKVS